MFGSKFAVVCLDAAEGTELWKYTTADWVSSSPAIDDAGVVYVGSQDGSVYALKPPAVVGRPSR